MGNARVTINLPEEIAAALEKRAAIQKRSVSNCVAVLIEEDLRTAGFITVPGGAENVEFFAKLAKALEAKPELKAELEKTIRATLRGRQGRAAA